MIRPLQANASGNLFVHLRDDTLVALHLKTSPVKTDYLIEFAFGGRGEIPQGAAEFKRDFAQNLQFFGQTWDVERLKVHGEQEGLQVELQYALKMGDMVAVHFSLQNKRSHEVELTSCVFERLTLGGWKGTHILQTTPIPHNIILSKDVVYSHERVSGTIFFPSFYLDHDQTIRLGFQKQEKMLAEVRFAL